MNLELFITVFVGSFLGSLIVGLPITVIRFKNKNNMTWKEMWVFTKYLLRV